MTLDHFFKYFEEELKQNEPLTQYHRFINSPKLYDFRKSYLEQRYQFVLNQIEIPHAQIWDVGCGYGTTSILLGLNGHQVLGSTLEYYFDEIKNRLKYWSQFGDISKVRLEYQNMFDEHPPEGSLDYIVAQDTLHHLEPFDKAVEIFDKVLKPGGKIIVSEENGNNIICNIKHFRERGFKRISSYYDERLKKEIVFGNENTRSLSKWEKEFSKGGFQINEDSLEYIRYFMPGKYDGSNTDEIIKKESRLWRKSSILREFFFFGMNFTVQRRK